MTLAAKDKDGGIGTTMQTITVTNVAPRAILSNGPAGNVGQEGTAISLTASATDPGAAEGVVLSWSVAKNGASYASGTGSAVSFLPDDNGFYVVTLTATDKDGAIGTTSQPIVVFDVAPTATITSPAIIGAAEGTAISLTGTAADVSPVDTKAGLALSWTVDRTYVSLSGVPTVTTGFATGAGSNFTFLPDDNGTYTVTLVSTDKDGAVSLSDARTIIVANVAPTPTILGAPATSPEGTPIALASSVIDSSTADQATGFTGGWSISENGVVLGTSGKGAISFTPTDNGTYVFTLSLTDKDGGMGIATQTIVVTNAPPAVTRPADQASSEGSNSLFSLGSFTDPGIYDGLWSVDVNWGDGSAHTTFTTASLGAIAAQGHAYADDGTYTATVHVTDKDQGVGAASFHVNVAIVPPTAVILGSPTSSPEGTAIRLGSDVALPNATVTVGFAETWSVTKNGAPFQIGTGPNFSFTPDDNGTYVATLSATDADGDGTATVSTRPIIVTDVAPTATLTSGAITYGQQVSLTAPFDPSSLDTKAGFRYAFALTPDALSGTTYATASTSPTSNLSGLVAGKDTVYARIIDKDGGYTQYSSTVTVNKATLTVTANPRSKNFGDSVTFAGTEFTSSGLVYKDTLTSVTLASPGAAASAVAGTYPITPSAAVGSGLGNYTITYAAGTLTVGAKPGSVYILDPSASAALSLSGSSTLSVIGDLFVDSTSSSAISASGAATVTASRLEVAGGISVSGSATSPRRRASRAHSATPTPPCPPPSPSGTVQSVSLGGNSTQTISPGTYSSIKVSGSAKLTLNPGVYIIAGGGLSVSGAGAISGTGVMIYNAGSNVLGGGGTTTFGGIGLNGSGQVQLTASTSGTYAGVLFFQSRDNTRAFALSGAATLGITGMIYAPNALLSLSGSAQLQSHVTLVVDQLQLSGSVSSSLTTDASGSSAGQLLAGDLAIYINDPAGYLGADAPGRIDDAVAFDNALLAPYSVTLMLTSDPSVANLTIDTNTTSASGGYTDGVLGNYSSSGEITLIRGWNWFTGADPSLIGSDQYDFETIISHELGHALGLGHSADPNSTMFASLDPDQSRRDLIAADLGIRDPDGGPDGLHASRPTVATTAVGGAGVLIAPADAVSSALDGFYPVGAAPASASSTPNRTAISTPGRLSWLAGRAIPGVASSLLSDGVSQPGKMEHETDGEPTAHPTFSATGSIHAPERPRSRGKRAQADAALPKPSVIPPRGLIRKPATTRPERSA